MEIINEKLNEMMVDLFEKSTRIDLITSNVLFNEPLGELDYQDPEHNGEYSLDRVVTNISHPQLTIFTPEHSNGCGILVIPGGGYQAVMFDKEGTALAPFFLSKGYTIFVLTYRLPSPLFSDDINRPFNDAILAMMYIRKNASKWKIEKDRIGIMGFSAGGHVAAMLITQAYNADSCILSNEKIDINLIMPNFAGLIYPVISMSDSITHKGSKDKLISHDTDDINIKNYSAECNVNSKLPPVFLLHCCDDPLVPVENSLLMFDSLIKYNVPTEMHIYEKGGHGFGIQWTSDLPVKRWPELFINWIESKIIY